MSVVTAIASSIFAVLFVAWVTFVGGDVAPLRIGWEVVSPMGIGLIGALTILGISGLVVFLSSQLTRRPQ